MPQIETATGLHRIDRVLQARSLRPYKGQWRVKRVAFGAADYAHELGLTVGPEEAEPRRRAGLGGARFARGGTGRSDRQSVVSFQGRRRLCARPGAAAAAASRAGSACIPTVAPVNAAYLPSDAELAHAERIVAAFRQAEARGEAAVQVDGEMVDYPVAYRAQALLDSFKKAAERPCRAYLKDFAASSA